MAIRRVQIEGREWKVYPSGYVTQYDADEFGLIFISGSGDNKEVRLTRYSPTGVKSREESLAMLSDDELRGLFAMSQPSSTAPEAGYAP